jgi:hypothetical protein
MIKKLQCSVYFLFLFVALQAQVNFAAIGNKINSTATSNAIFINGGGNVGTLHNFAITDPTTCNSVITGPDGKLYGISKAGGTFNNGALFSMNDEGSNFSVIYNIPTLKYFYYQAPLPCFGADGKIYINIADSIFKIDPITTVALPLVKLPFTQESNKQLVTDNAGWLYGIGTDATYNLFIYKIQTDGLNYQVIHVFNGSTEGTPGYDSNNSFCISPTGRIFGLCVNGPNFGGTFYSLRPDGTNFTVHKSFGSVANDGLNPTANGTPVHKNGKILFSTNTGGINGNGQLYAYDTTTSITTSIFDYPSTTTNTAQPIIGNGNLVGLNNIGLYSINENGTNFQQSNTIPSEGRLTYSSLSNKIYYTPNGGAYRNFYLNKIDATSLVSINIHDFGNVPLGYSPDAIFKAPDSKLYGYCKKGGTTGGGNIFKMNVDGSNFQIIHQFDDANGQVPIGQMMYGSDSRLYGVCDKSGAGGSVSNRLIFGMNTDGSNYTILKTFTTAALDGRLVGEVVEGTGGNLYGCTGHGDFNFGVFTSEPNIIFKINKNGTGYIVLKRFNVNGSEGRTIRKGLTYYNGFLYGCCKSGGTNDAGNCFRINENGTGFAIIKSFGVVASDGINPNGGLTLASNNKLYGTTSLNGLNDGFFNNTFSINPADLSFQILYVTPDFDYTKGYLGVIESKIYQASDSKLYQSRASGLFVMDLNGSNANFIQPAQYWFNINYYPQYDVPLSYLTEIPFINVLPIKLSNFSANKKNNVVVITWQTAEEINAEKYEVEKSNNASFFNKLTSIHAKGNSSTGNNYETIDEKPFMGNNYYRLKIIDRDGKIEYSPIKIVNFSSNLLFTIYPNPAIDIIQIENKFISGLINVSINDNTGKTVKQLIFKNMPTFTIDIKSLSAGIYIIKIQTEKEIYSSSFLKK